MSASAGPGRRPAALQAQSGSWARSPRDPLRLRAALMGSWGSQLVLENAGARPGAAHSRSARREHSQQHTGNLLSLGALRSSDALPAHPLSPGLRARWAASLAQLQPSRSPPCSTQLARPTMRPWAAALTSLWRGGAGGAGAAAAPLPTATPPLHPTGAATTQLQRALLAYLRCLDAGAGPGFALEQRPSKIPGAGDGVFLRSGRVRPGAVLTLCELRPVPSCPTSQLPAFTTAAAALATHALHCPPSAAWCLLQTPACSLRSTTWCKPWPSPGPTRLCRRCRPAGRCGTATCCSSATGA